MSFVLDCPACRKSVTATRDLIGRTIACPYCAQHFQIPADGAAPVPLARAAPAASVARAAVRFTFHCQRCGSILEARGNLSGQQGRCPTCGAVFIVPEVDAQTGIALGPAVVADDGQLPTPMHAYATAGGRAPKIVRRADGSQAIVCPRCERDMPVDANICTSCGIPFTMEGAASVTESGPGYNSIATAALTVGVISILTFCIPIGGPIAIYLGWRALQRANQLGNIRSGRGMALAGLICGIVASTLSGLFYGWQYL